MILKFKCYIISHCNTEQQVQRCTTFSAEMFKMFDFSIVKLNCPRKLILFYFLSGFSFTDTDDSQDTSTRSQIFRHLFATLHVRWLSHIFNRTACIYQTATRWDLPHYRIAISLIDHVMLFFVCLLDNLMLGFCYSNLTWETGGLEPASTITLVL